MTVWRTLWRREIRGWLLQPGHYVMAAAFLAGTGRPEAQAVPVVVAGLTMQELTKATTREYKAATGKY